MSLSLLKAIILQKNDMRAFAMGPFPNGKYGSVLYFIKGNTAICPVLSVESGYFDTCREAIEALENVLTEVRGLDLPKQEKELENIFEFEDSDEKT